MQGRKNRFTDGGLDCCYNVTEVFGGAGMVSLAMRESGYQSQIFDVRRDSTSNIHTKDGLYKVAVMLVLTKDLALIEPTCASWGWVNLGSSLRGVDPKVLTSKFLPLKWELYFWELPLAWYHHWTIVLFKIKM